MSDGYGLKFYMRMEIEGGKMKILRAEENKS